MNEAGIYIHIPFCRSKCFYCGFYSVASSLLKEGFLQALFREMELRKEYLNTRKAATLYLGGGTPSYLSVPELQKLVDKVESVYLLKPEAERTIEMNPEDLNADKLAGLKQLNFNRISIGVQSFQEVILKKLNRKHSAQQVTSGIEIARKLGFRNISIDLMIGLPEQSLENIHQDLKQAIQLQVDHISVYMLSIDPGSVLEKQYRKGIFLPQSDDELAVKYDFVAGKLKEQGFEHYEISNFARQQKYSVHNTSYWQQKPYIGLGPSAHSYDLVSRQWNVSNLKSYIDNLNNNRLIVDREELSEIDCYNEYIMTNLRTMWGIDTEDMKKQFGFAWKHFDSQMEIFIAGGWAVKKDTNIRLTEKGWLISDKIFSELFLPE